MSNYLRFYALMGKKRQTYICFKNLKTGKHLLFNGRNFIKIWKTFSLYKKLNKSYQLISIHRIDFLKNLFYLDRIGFCGFNPQDGDKAYTSKTTKYYI